MTFQPTVSIIVNTDGRVDSLQRTLESLRFLDYPNFEVCVVHGPTPDGTKELLERYRSLVKIAHCPTRNLSRSRNIGIGLSAGEILAFLDDDSIPETEWLTEVTKPFENADVAACGGFLHDNTGVGYQWRFGTVNRMAVPDQSWSHPPLEFNFPYTANFPHVMANSAFRKSAALEIGGFDEQYEYFLDETDFICRLVDRGWRIVPIAGAAVHHKFRDSRLREKGVIKSWYSIVKSKIYFSLVNNHGHHTLWQALEGTRTYVDGLKANLEWGIAQGLASDTDRARFDPEVERALRDGISNGLANGRQLVAKETLAERSEPLLQFAIHTPTGSRQTLCFLTKTYPPAPIGGIGRHIHQLAPSIARQGHQVHVLTRGIDHDTVDFEDGVWVHRICPKPQRRPDGALTVPSHIWDHSATMLAEVEKIANARHVDAVIAPIWDCEGIAFLLDQRFRLITGLYTPLRHWLDSHPHRRADDAFMRDFVTPMLECERLLFTEADGVLADSESIVEEIEQAYDLRFDPARLAVVPLGLEDWTKLPLAAPGPRAGEAVRLLFVGRLEERKGIDVLLEAAKQILAAHAEAHLDIIGDDRLKSAKGPTYRELFEADREADAIRSRVHFHSEVSEPELRGFYQACDIFVAPSRFESFGLILLEAMMFGKPVIGCRAGGMTEIIEHGVSGLLAVPGDAASLTDCLRQLIDSAELRARFGAAGRDRYERMFTADIMGQRTVTQVTALPGKPRVRDVLSLAPPDSPVALHAPRRAQRRCVVLINGILARNDAVSASVRDMYLMLSRDRSLEVVVFAARNDYADVPCRLVAEPGRLLLDPDFLRADLIIWHFAIFYELFKALFIGNARAPQVVVFHNITPKQFMPEHSWPLIDLSNHQCHGLRYAHEIWNVSAVNAATARSFGVPDERMCIVPLAVEEPSLHRLSDKPSSPIEIIFVSRFVRSKGVLDLIEAVAQLQNFDIPPFHVTLAGNLEFSDNAYVEEVRNGIVARKLSDRIDVAGTIDAKDWEALYARAHILAMPSYHEGFCKPVFEGLRAGCIPVGYASYNLPEAANGLGRMVAPGNIAEFAAALAELLQALPAALAQPHRPLLNLDRGQLSVAAFEEQSHAYVRQYSRAEIGATVLSRVKRLLGSPEGAPAVSPPERLSVSS